MGVALTFKNIFMTSGSCKTSLTANAILFTTLAGMLGGPTKLPDVVALNPASVSLIAGTSGNEGLRFKLLTAMALTLPDLICGKAALNSENIKSICPPKTATRAGPVPLKGMCVNLTSAVELNISAAKCPVLPEPGEP